MIFRCRSALWAAAASLWLVAGVSAQEWRGSARVKGVVQELHGDAIEGAVVTLSLGPNGEAGPAPATVDDEGRWAVVGLAGGRWEIGVTAEGFQPTLGWTNISESQPNAPVRIRLKPLEEASPGFSEGNPATIRAWLDKGNVLLEQGRYEDARTEYEKALRQLPDGSKPEVLRSVGRTYFLEGDVEGTLRALQQALYFEASDEVTRQLVTALLGELGRSDEAASLMADLDRRGRDVFDASDLFDRDERPGGAGGGIPESIASLRLESAIAGRRGRYRVFFTERNPGMDMEEILERLGVGREELEALDPDSGRYRIERESFHVFVPEGYEPAGTFGLFVWVSPTRFGGFVSDDMKRALEEHKLIWVGADNAGNPRIRWYRSALAIDAAHSMSKLYTIDPQRVYIAGYSGGGRVASGMVSLFPEVFHGGFSFYGCDYFRRVELPDRPGAYWSPKFPEPDRSALKDLHSRSHYVLLTGELDFNRFQTFAIYERMLEDGFRHVTYLEIPGASHYTRAPSEWLARGFEALDARPVR